MINVIGHIKIDESKPDRVHQFFATVLSFDFCKKIYLGITLESPSNELIEKLGNLLSENYSCSGKEYYLHCHHNNDNNYFDGIKIHLSEVNPKHYLNFEEDHFCIVDDYKLMEEIFEETQIHGVDYVRASYFGIETRSMDRVSIALETDLLKIFMMHKGNFEDFNYHYKRFFIGINSIFSKTFADRLYNKPGKRPHDFEVGAYNESLRHICAVPKHEILRSIDNDHELPGSCLLKNPTKKFIDCMAKAEKYLK